MCVTVHNDMTLAVKVAFNPNTTNQPTNQKEFLYPNKQSFEGILESPCLSVRMYICTSIRPCVTKSCPGHNFKSIKASNFKLHTQIGHIVEKCSVQEP